MKNKKRIMNILVAMVMIFTIPVSAFAAETEKNVEIPKALEEKLPLLDTIGPTGVIDKDGNITIPEEIPFVETENGGYVAFIPLERAGGFGGALTMNLFQFHGSIYELTYRVVSTGFVNGVKFNYSIKQGMSTLTSGYVNHTFVSTKLYYGDITKFNIYAPATVTGRISNCRMYSLEYGWLSGNSNSWTWNF